MGHHREEENDVRQKQEEEIITTHSNKNNIYGKVTDKNSRDTVNDEGDYSSLQLSNMSNVDFVKDNVEISETVYKPAEKKIIKCINITVTSQHLNQLSMKMICQENMKISLASTTKHYLMIMKL